MRKTSRQTRVLAPPAGERAGGWNWLPLSGILLAALLLRLLALRGIVASDYGSYLLWDERIYHEWARQIAAGLYRPSAVYEFAPLPAYIMAALYRLLSPDPLLVRLLNVALGTAACGLLFLIGRHVQDRRTGLLAAGLGALYQPFILYSVVPLKEMLGLVLFAAVVTLFLALLAAVHRRARSALLWAGLLGLAAGFLLNVRPNAVAILPVLALVVALRAWRAGTEARRTAALLLALGLGLLLAISPFALRNYRVAGSFALVTSQMGFNLYLGNNPGNPTPYYRPVPFATTVPFEQGVQFTIEASRRAGRTLSSEEASSFWTREVLASAAAAPGPFAWRLGQKTLALVNRFEACDHYHIPFLSRFVPFFRFPLPAFWMVLALAAAGLAAGGIRPGARGPLLLLAAAYAATLVAFFPNGRYRLLLLVVLIPLAACGLARALRSLREGWSAGDRRLAGAALLAAIVAWLPVPGAGDLTAYYNTHAIVVNAQGRTREAVPFWQASATLGGVYSDFARLSLARLAYAQGRYEEGDAGLRRIDDATSFAAAQKHDLLGDGWVRRSGLREAAAAYARSLAINSGERRTRRKLIELDRFLDPPQAAIEAARLQGIEAFYRGL